MHGYLERKKHPGRGMELRKGAMEDMVRRIIFMREGAPLI